MCICYKIDLIRGYHQIPVHLDDVCKTAISTHLRLYEFTRMPFGLQNTSQTFQRLMDSIVGGLEEVFVYLSDVLMVSLLVT